MRDARRRDRALKYRSYFLPIAAAEREVRFGGASLAAADLDPAALAAILDGLGRAPLAGSLAERCRAVAGAAERLLDGPLRRAAEELLPRVTGFSPEMIHATLPRVLRPLASRDLESLARRAAARAHRLVGVVAAGNVPGVALAKTALALAAGASCFVKSASGEPVLAVLFAHALRDADRRLAGRLAVAWWKGAQGGLDAALARGVDALVAYGSDEAIAAFAALAPRQLVAHGARRSFAIVRLEQAAPLESLARSAALDVALHDQLGCLSPQWIYVAGADGERTAFAAALARALEELASVLPRGAVPESASLAIGRLRDEVEWRAIAGDPVSLHASTRGTAWTVAVESDSRVRSCPLYRTIRVQPLPAFADLRRALGDALPTIESVGVAPWPHEEIAAELAELGIPRVAPLGRMQEPDLGWRQGGRDPLAGIVGPETASPPPEAASA